MPEGRMVSPNEIWEAAKVNMLEGRQPATAHDYALMLNFVAGNIIKGCESPVCKIMKQLYDIPLRDEIIEQIAVFQMERK